ncbi:MAG: hypothetical protein ACYTF7_04470 [Planctomycetota bacterium]|jgi:hypothetical protein
MLFKPIVAHTTALLSVALFGADAPATVTVKDHTGALITNTSIVDVSQNATTLEWEVRILDEYPHATFEEMMFYVDGDDGDVIAFIEVEIIEDPSSTPNINIRLNKYNGLEFGLPTPISEVKEIRLGLNNSHPVFLHLVDMEDALGNKGSLGSINVHVIENIANALDITGDIDLENTIPYAGGSNEGYIENISIHGVITGDIRVDNGRIENISCNKIGSYFDHTLITAQRGLWSISTVKSIYSTIRTVTAGSQPNNLFELSAERLDGILEVRTLDLTDDQQTQPNITLTGGLDGNIYFTGPFEQDGSFQPFISVPEDELKGSIVIDTDDVQEVTGIDDSWSADVKIGTGANEIILNAPGYQTLSSEIGGGSVGVVPFTKHDFDSYPVEEGTPATQLWTDYTSGYDTVAMKFYGPIRMADSPTTPGIKIEQAYSGAYCAEGTYTDVTSQFTIVLDSFDGHQMLITETSPNQFSGNTWFRITPTSDLLCDVPTTYGDIPVDQAAELKFYTDCAPPPPPPPDPCDQECDCPRTCVRICDPCFGLMPGESGTLMASSTESGETTLAEGSTGAVVDQLLLNPDGSHVQYTWLFPGPLAPGATSGTRVDSFNRPSARISPDINRDGLIDEYDLNEFMIHYGCMDCFDLDGDWSRQESDLAILMAAILDASSPSVE